MDKYQEKSREKDSVELNFHVLLHSDISAQLPSHNVGFSCMRVRDVISFAAVIQ